MFTMRENMVTGHEVLNHYEPIIANVDVLQIISSQCPVKYEGAPSVWTYVYPGNNFVLLKKVTNYL